MSRRYDLAKTPFQWVSQSEHIDQSTKDLLTKEYEALDPVDLLSQMEKLQDQLWQQSGESFSQSESELVVITDDEMGPLVPVDDKSVTLTVIIAVARKPPHGVHDVPGEPKKISLGRHGMR